MRATRRAFLAGAGGFLVAGAGGGDCPTTAFLSCGAGADGSYCLAGLDRAGGLVFILPLPGRGHGMAVRPRRLESVVFARRPGTFALAFDHRTGAVARRWTAPAGRTFCGHGAFSADGGTLFATENDFEAGRGVLGIYDAAAGYRRLGEVATHGIGPHQVLPMPDGRTLCVANGGILTHPDLGRAKLNLETMAPSLAYIDASTGALLEAARLEQRLHRLSIRHIAVNRAGLVAIAMQYEGPRGDRVPLVGLHARGRPIRLMEAAPDPGRGMRQYTGSVEFDAAGARLAVSSPRGGLARVWDAATCRPVGEVAAADACGLAPLAEGAGFLLTAGDGTLRRLDAAGAKLLAASPVRWDNHAVALRA